MNLYDFRANAYKAKNVSEVKSESEKKDNSQIENSLEVQKKIIPAAGQFKSDERTVAAAKALTSGGLIKVPEQPKEDDGRENVYRRVAKFLVLIGVNEAAKILPHLTQEQTEKVIPEIASIRSVDPEEANVILAEFQSLVAKAREDSGFDTAKEILEKAFGKERAAEMLEKVSPKISGKPFEYLLEADSEKIEILLKDESAPVRALVLAHLNPKISADVINKMNPEDKKEVILRFAKLKSLDPEVVRRVDQAMMEKMNSISVEKSDTIDGRNTLAQILKRMSPDAETEILQNLSEYDAELGSDIKERLFTIEDILAADDRFIQNYLRNLGEEDIAHLIAQKKQEFRDKILNNVSENRRKSILETEQFLKPMRKSDCDKITAKVFSDLRHAYEEGKLIIIGREDEIYV